MFTSIDPQGSATAEPKSAPDSAASAYRGPERRRSVAALFDPIYVGRFVWRCRWLVASTTLAGLGFAATLAVTTPKDYVAESQILVDPRDIKVVQNEVAPNALPSDATLALIESQTAVVTSDRVLSGVIARTGLAEDPEFNGTAKGNLLQRLLPQGAEPPAGDRAAIVNQALRRALTVTREPKSFIVHLSMKTQDPEKSARLANALSDAFIAELGHIQSDTARRATVALSSRLNELRRSVVEAEGKVEDYKNQNALIGVNGRLVDDDYITRTNDELARVRATIAALRVKAASLRNARLDDVLRGGLPEEIGSDALTRLRQGYADLMQQASSLAVKLGPRHPQRMAAESALGSARDSIRHELDRIVSAGQVELTRAEATERDLSRQVSDLKAKQAETSGSFVKLRELEREVEASRAVYEAFLLRARETSEQESLNTANIRVISEAVPPLKATGASVKLVTVAGAIAGFLLGAGLAAALAMLRLVIGFLRQDRRGAGGAGRAIWTEAERAANRRAMAAAAAAESPMPAATEKSAPVPPQPVARPAVSAPMPVPAPSPEDAAPLGRAALRERIRALAAAQDGVPPRQEGMAAEAIRRQLLDVRDSVAEFRRERQGEVPRRMGGRV
ncbi:hypothetical protein GCM10011390_14620 [Aureimonas endophytica]|uniref:Lipopolysaccharide biosynthesis protein n=1 Tax=Aureimonas endophytica TaxID=2027858 RepID=A0A916ZGU8_9HYPH|nr:GumC family protein [Aureimonas endophytica]GGD96950.1 hypothetical protein GCM10011390_14620 [Aureimonas endophytica]